jgi:uncharacterized protein YjbI with pentapeptide repeats
MYPDRPLIESEFVHCDLQQAKIMGCELEAANFSESWLVGLRACHSRFQMGKAIDTVCVWSSWRFASLRGANLENADFSGADISHCDFSGSDLTGAKFRGAQAVGADFSGANLAECDFSLANLSQSVFSNARLSRTNFSFSDLSDCQFHPVNFSAGNYHRALREGIQPRDWPERAPRMGDDAYVALAGKFRTYCSAPRKLSLAVLWYGRRRFRDFVERLCGEANHRIVFQE